MAEIKRRKQSSKGKIEKLHKPNKKLPWISTKKELPPPTHDKIVYYLKDVGADIGVSYIVLQHMTKKDYPIHVLAWFLLEEASCDRKG